MPNASQLSIFNPPQPSFFQRTERFEIQYRIEFLAQQRCSSPLFQRGVRGDLSISNNEITLN